MSKIITLRKGLDINLRGKAQESLADAPQASEYALSPLDFEGVTPKLLVKVGDEVKAGRLVALVEQDVALGGVDLAGAARDAGDFVRGQAAEQGDAGEQDVD